MRCYLQSVRRCTPIYTTVQHPLGVTHRRVLYTVFELPGGLGGLNPPTSSCRPPYLWSKFDPGGVEFQSPHLSFSEVGMLLDSHFLPMQFLKYLYSVMI